MRRGWRTALLLLALASRAAGESPSGDWRTLETEHFRIHFPAPFEAWARRAAGPIEGIHERVAELVGYAPPQRIEVIVGDPDADANGAALPYLDRPQIVLWAFPPEAESSTGEFSDWVELLVTHEVAHIAHLARPGDGPLAALLRFSPAPFGPLALRAPRWLLEGYATLVEGALTGSGRPASSYRAMMLRQLAIDGKLPPYDKLGRTSGWPGGSMAYLAGSAYLEWLAGRAGKDSLPRLWKRMALGEGGGFDAAFRRIFGQPPKDLYGTFTADITAGALAQDKRLRDAGLSEGALWQRVDGGTSSPAVSPDGLKLLVRRDPGPRESFLAIWDIADGDPEHRVPRWTLPRANGLAAADPRWMPDGKGVLFARRAPDAEGVLRFDLYRWDLVGGGVSPITRGADAADADPSSDGRTAVAVRDRFGVSALVRVDLATGQTRELSAVVSGSDGWPLWSHPRFSPDGRRIAALLHSGGRWRLVTLPTEGGAVSELASGGGPVAPPAWSPDGSRLYVTEDSSGIWNIAAIDATGAAVAEELTRVTGGAFAPAPAPDGKALFFLEWTGKGVDVRRLDLAGPAVAPAARPTDAYPLLPPSPSGTTPPLAIVPVPASRPYSIWPTMAVRSLINFGFGPDGNAVQLGLDGGDVIGRLHWLAAASIGNAAGPRGGTVAAAWRGFPVEISAQLFSALEKPGSQSLAPRPGLDAQRRGGFLQLSWARPFAFGRVRIESGWGATRVEALAGGDRFSRSLGSARGQLALRRTRGRSGVGVDFDLYGAAGWTDGSSWSQAAGGARLLAITSVATLSAAGRWGGTGGSPTRFDLFAIGGAPSAILPAGLDRNRIDSPALPAAVLLGERLETYHAEAAIAAVPVAVYAEWFRAWSGGEARPQPVRAIGAEARLERLVPAEFDRTLTFRVGLAWIDSETPRFRTVRGYAGLLYRP